jgi:hypothetical protein
MFGPRGQLDFIGRGAMLRFANRRTRRKQTLETVNMPLQLAPASLYQPILPGWQVSLFSINLGASSDAEIEQTAIQQVGSYGKQIGHLGEALDVVIKQLKLLDSKSLSTAQKDALQVFLGDVSATRGVKARKGSASASSIASLIGSRQVIAAGRNG